MCWCHSKRELAYYAAAVKGTFQKSSSSRQRRETRGWNQQEEADVELLFSLYLLVGFFSTLNFFLFFFLNTNVPTLHSSRSPLAGASWQRRRTSTRKHHVTRGHLRRTSSVTPSSLSTRSVHCQRKTPGQTALENVPLAGKPSGCSAGRGRHHEQSGTLDVVVKIQQFRCPALSFSFFFFKLPKVWNQIFFPLQSSSRQSPKKQTNKILEGIFIPRCLPHAGLCSAAVAARLPRST